MLHGGARHAGRPLRVDWSKAARCFLVGALLAMVLAAVLSSCSEVVSPGRPDCFMVVTDYQLHIDSMRVTTPIELGDTLRVWLWGPIGAEGSDECFGFTRILSFAASDSLLMLSALGWSGSGPCCPDDTLAYLHGAEYSYIPKVAGHVTVVLNNHLGPDLVDTVHVLSGEPGITPARSN